MVEFRDDIQCLRGISLLFVFLYHFDKSKLPTGFIGVDVFYFISGYVNVLSYLSKENNVIISFFLNRIKRIFPTSHLCLCASILLITKRNMLYQNKQLTDILYALLSLSNYRFIYLYVDYLSQNEPPSIALHFWSLSIEDQFYLFFPFYITFVYKNEIILIIICIISFLYSIYVNIKRHYISYFSFLSRSYQFLLGILSTKRINAFNAKYIINNDILIICLVFCCIYVRNDKYFPSPLSIFPLIIVNIILTKRSKSYVLNSKMLLELGNISFCFYLFHYLIIYINNGKKSFYILSLTFTLTLLLSFIINKYYENPIRRIKNNRTICFFFILSLCIIIYVCMKLIRRNKYSYSNFTATKIPHKYNGDKYIHIKSNKISYSPDELKKTYRQFYNSQCFCILKYKKYDSIINRYPIVLLLTDSHGEQWFNTIIPYAKKMNYVAIHVWFWEDTILNRNFKNIYKIFLTIPKIKYIVSAHFLHDQSNRTLFNQNYLFYLNALLQHSEKIYVIHDTPHFKENPNICLLSSLKIDNCFSLIGINASHYFFPIYYSKRIRYINMIPFICQNSYKCYHAWNSIPIYLDNNHLSLQFTYILSQKLLKFIHFDKQYKNFSLKCDQSFKCRLSSIL